MSIENACCTSRNGGIIVLEGLAVASKGRASVHASNSVGISVVIIVVAVTVKLHASRRSRTSGRHWIVAKHSHARTILGATKRDHVLADMGGNGFAVLRIGVRQDPLDEIVAKLVARNVDERHARTIWTGFADTVEVLVQEIVTSNLKALLDNL